MKKICFTLAALSLAATASIQAAPFQVNVPSLKSGITFSLAGLYLRPSNSDLTYASIINTPMSNNTNVYLSSVKPSYHFGFHAGLGYVFPNSGNDVQLSWTHLNASDSDSTQIKSGQTFGPLEAPNLFIVNANGSGSASGDAQFKYNAADLTVGQYINFGSHVSSRFFAGIRYASIDRNLDRVYGRVFTTPVAPDGLTSMNLSVADQSKFDGVGPRFGVKSTYHMCNFGIVGQVGASLLVGEVKAEQTAKLVSAFVNNPTATTTQPLHSTASRRVVPELDGKLGLNYAHAFNQGSLFTVEAGYQVAHYFNAIDRIVSTANNATFSRKTSGFGVDGPYIALNLKVG